jgi:hypothetical protein
MANIKLSKLIKKINKEHKPPSGWRASDKIPSAQALKQAIQETVPYNDIEEASVQAPKRGASRQAQLGRKPNKIR